MFLCFYLFLLFIPTIRAQCKPKIFKINNWPSPIYRFEEYTFSVLNDPTEKCVQESHYQWRVYVQRSKLDLVKSALAISETKEILNETFNTLRMSEAKVTDVYSYDFLFNLVLQHKNKNVQLSQNFKVIPHDLQVIIKGGEDRTYELNTGGLVLDGSASTDPSYRDWEKPMQGNAIKWTCSPEFGKNGRKPEQTSALVWKITDDFLEIGKTYNCTLTVTRTKTKYFKMTKSYSQVVNVIDETIPNFSVNCIGTNCPTCPDDKCLPAMDSCSSVTFQAKCTANCTYKTLSWDISPQDPKVMAKLKTNVILKEDTITFLGDSFSPDDIVTFIAKYSGFRKNTTERFRAPVPKFSFIFDPESSSDPRLDKKLKANCTSDCCRFNVKYLIEPPTNTSYIDENEYFVIKKNSYIDGDDLQITAIAWDAMQTTTIKMHEEAPILEIVCSDSCEFDPREEVRLTVNCVEFCYMLSNYTWTVDPHIPEAVTTDNDVLVISGNVTTEGTTLRVTAFNGKGKDFVDVKYVELIPKITVKCIDNCHPPNPALPITFQAECIDKCRFLDYSWDLKPHPWTNWPAGISPDKTQLKIPEDTFDAHETVKVTVTSGKGSDFTSVKFVEIYPQLIIGCQENCEDFNPLKTTTYNVTCTDVCFVKDYVWDLSPPLPDFSWSENVVLGNGNETITFLPGSFPDGVNITIVVKARGGHADRTDFFLEPTPKLELNCVRNCNNSNPSQLTRINVTCSPPQHCENATYVWELEDPTPESSTWWAKFEPTPDNSSVAIKPSSFEDGDVIVLKVSKRKGVDKITIKFIEPTLDLEIHCKPLCGPDETHNPLMPTRISVSCSNCDNATFEWTLDPPPEDWARDIQMHARNTSFIIVPEAYKDGDVLNVMVKSSKANATQTIKFYEPIPQLEILCETNCIGSDPLNITTLTAKCRRLCDNATFFEWSFEPDTVDWQYNVTETPNNMTIKIASRVFRDKDQINITVKSRKGNHTRLFNFIQPETKFYINCTFNCKYNPRHMVILEAVCTKNCQDTYSWDLTQVGTELALEEAVTVFPDNSSYKINPDVFKDMDVVTVHANTSKGESIKVIAFSDPAPEMMIICEENCNTRNEANPLKATKFSVTCLDLCDHLNYTWIFYPPPPNSTAAEELDKTKSNSSIILLPNAYTDGYSTQVSVTSGHGKVSMDVYFVEPIPTIEITCIENCGETSDPLADVKLKATCRPDCETMVWDISPKERDFEFGKSVTIGKGNKTMTIRNNTYLTKEEALVTVTSRKGKGELKIIFVTSPPSLNLTCVQNCPDAHIYVDVVLKVTCNPKCDSSAKFAWSIVPLPQEFSWSQYVVFSRNNDTLTILKDTFLDAYDTTVFVKGNNGTEASARVTFSVQPPDIHIQCIEPCDYSHTKPVTFEVICSGDYCRNIQYKWSLNPEPRTAEMLVNNGMTFTIPPGVYKENQTVDVIVESGRSRRVMTVTFHLPPWDGTCGMEPNDGISGYTEFFAECIDFTRDATFRLYQAIETMPWKTGVLLDYGQSVFFNGFYLSEAAEPSVQILAGIGWDTSARVELSSTVEPLTPGEKYPGDLVSTIQSVILGKGSGDLDALAARHSKNRFVQTVSLLDTALNRVDRNIARHMKTHLLQKMVNITRQIEPTQSLSIVMKLAFDLNPTDSYIIDLLMENTQISCARMRKLANKYSTEAIRIYSDDVGEIIAHLIELNDKLDTTDFSAFGNAVRDVSLFPTAWQQVDTIQHKRYFVVNLLRTTKCLQQILRVDKNVTYLSSNETFFLAIDATGGELPRTIQAKEHVSSFVHLPSEFGLRRKDYDGFVFNFAEYKKNPMRWDLHETNTPVILFSVKAKNRKNIIDFPAPVKIFFGNTEELTVEVSESAVDTKMFKIQVPKNALLKITFNQASGQYNVTITDSIPSAATLVEQSFAVFDEQMAFRSKSGIVFITIQNPRDSKAAIIPVSFTYTVHECLVWNNDKWAWGHEGCYPDAESPRGYITCKCTNLAAVTARSSAPQITEVDSSDLDREKGKYNYIYAATVSVLAAALATMLWALWRDYKTPHTVVKLDDNIPGDKTLYFILVCTGLTPDSATSADVFFQLFGSKSNSRPHRFHGHRTGHLQRKNRDIFAFYEPEHLGDLISIKIWHTSAGAKPHWYCQQIIIHDVSEKLFYNFPVEKWFSLVRENGLTSGTFPVQKNFKASNLHRFRDAARLQYSPLLLLIQSPRPHGNKEAVALLFVTVITTMTSSLLLLRNVDQHDYWTIVYTVLIVVAIETTIVSALNFMFMNTRYS